MPKLNRYFEEGEEAFAQDDELDDCPYPFDSGAGAEWCAGFEAAQYADMIESEGAREDRRLDNPHRRA